MKRELILSCEHGGNAVPPEYAALFSSQRAVKALAGHRGADIGALGLAEALAERLDAPLFAATVSRLLVDLNRSVGHPRLLSEFSRVLGETARRRLIAAHYDPHRDRVIEAIRGAVDQGCCVYHVAVHSFTPRLGSCERNADIGLLYDPVRPLERAFCARWRRHLRTADGALRVRRNYPYLGKTDGFTTHLRRQFGPGSYLGIELEVNQRLLRRAPRDTAGLIADSLASALTGGLGYGSSAA